MKQRHRRRHRQPSQNVSRELLRLPLPRVEIDPDRQWWAIRCHHGRDRHTERQLAEISLPTWRPIMAFQSIRCGRSVQIERSPATGWLFAGVEKGVDAFLRWAAILGALERKTHQNPFLGVYGPIPLNVLQTFADHVAGTNELNQPFKIGHPYTIAEGPFIGLLATIDRIIGHRAICNINILGQNSRIELGIDSLQLAA